MSILKKDLAVSNVNSLNGYFPVRTSVTESAFDWEVAKGVVVRNVYRKILAKDMAVKEGEGASYSKFREVCQKDFTERLDEIQLWEYLEDMYFSQDTFFTIAPECLLFRIANLPVSSPKNRLGDLFSSLMQDYHNPQPERMKRNFLEQQLVDSLRSPDVLKDFFGPRNSKNIEEEPFLPFLTCHFRKDIKFLSDHPGYLIHCLEEFLRLYGYLYTAQLALNIDGYKSEPAARPLYFIMENETASLERTDLVRNGHQKVSSNIQKIFPYLTMAETLQEVAEDRPRIPLWHFASQLAPLDTPRLRQYAKDFAEDRDLAIDSDDSNEDPLYWLQQLLKLSLMQFEKGQTRSAAQGKFVRAAEVELCSTFVRARGRVGKVLVMNQDYLALLTNLAIGEKQRLRFHELLEEFRARGVYFDKKTQQSLIGFYERVGNVERMSDSGDAVYVRKTI
ncbi:DNA phosphorothioation-dependent restriction protein DptG [Halieaceae bacterium IMCC14734]|uniref:DNA phosphorothioation-dependent restriction protein DptG n=1 Tax=Candidatus Litorirhabdus singularis TaxID=2518993 RepID=A0ABT3TKL2_9GAMM|nr:DNA phosphorothioation-dependent restriction protein DptG [Candidatus Litorirhabdus singularis]MCX2982871.1 DNA phosphorothioation-dependent restriction protein DptG [Candidatus Litorirhabdus singularis]